MTDTPTKLVGEGIWARLRRRKVVQWGVVYVAAAWGFLQGLEYVGESFNWPQQVRQIAVLVLVIGLPIVLVLAWYHGDRGEQRFRGTELVIIALLFLIGGGIFWRFSRVNEVPSTADVTAEQEASTPALSRHTPAPDQKSIAVLPFVDMSAAKDQEYMSDGMAEELLNLLAKVPDLKVIARTSSFAFKGKDTKVEDIARELNVAHVLEGSVRKAGNKIRITAQLVRASDSTHLWSETYDRPLDDIFAVQDEIANAIVRALQIRLMGGTLSRQEGGTENLEAYQLYLRALSAHRQNTKESLDAESEYLQRAVDLDPNYGIAWKGLAWAAIVKIESGDLDPKAGFEHARGLARHALKVSPNLAGAHAALQTINMEFDWDWAAAETEGQRARAIDPTDVAVLNAAARLSMTLGRWNDAEAKLRLALSRDPLNTYLNFLLGMTYYSVGRFAESEAMYRTLLELEPEFQWAHAYLGKTLLAAGRPEAALAMVQQEPEKGNRLIYLPIVLQAAGHKVEADEALQAQILYWADRCAFCVATTYAYRGDNDLAMKWLERAYRQKDVGLVEIVGEHLLKNMADDPRYKAFLRKMKLPDWPSQTIAATGT